MQKKILVININNTFEFNDFINYYSNTQFWFGFRELLIEILNFTYYVNKFLYINYISNNFKTKYNNKKNF